MTLSAVFALAGVGCAYFNTLYNAEETYREAEKAQEAQEASVAAMSSRGGDMQVSDRNPQAAQYEIVIEKCKNVMARYPNSRHVDDAMLLSARALYRLGDYDEAASAVDSLQRRYPRTDLRADAEFLKCECFVRAEKYDLAAPALRDFTEQYRKHHDRPEALYLLCTSLMQLGLNQEAVATLARLEKDHGRSDYRFRAQVEMAEILAEKELYDESLDIYRRMSESRIPESVRFDVLMGMASVQAQVGEYRNAVETLGEIKRIPPGADNEPRLVILRARAWAGVDSTRRAIRGYKDVTKRFARGVYAAEAHFRLAELYESMDSLQVAQTNYSEVPRAYSGSEYAEEAIKRSSNIGRVLKLEQTSGDDSPEAIAIRTFSMAEIQYFQFNSPEKAIPNYEQIVANYPDSEYAPRAAYALGYIHGVVLGDSAKAREWYDVLRSRYPDSPQTQFAQAFYKGAVPPPPYSELMKAATVKTASTQGTQPRREPPASRPTPPVPAPVDTTRANPQPVVTDTTRTSPPPPAPADTSAAPSDTTRGPN